MRTPAHLVVRVAKIEVASAVLVLMLVLVLVVYDESVLAKKCEIVPPLHLARPRNLEWRTTGNYFGRIPQFH